MVRHKLKALTMRLKVRVSNSMIFREETEIRIACSNFQERHQRGNLMSQVCCFEEEAGHSRPALHQEGTGLR